MKLFTKRLVLRPWEEKDADMSVEGINNYEVSKWLAQVPYPYTKADAQDWIKRCQTLTDAYEWAIDLNGKVIGGIGLKVKDGVGNGGIWISQSYHGNGYGAEAWRARNRFAFETLKVTRLESGYFVGNEGSRLLHERSGYKPTSIVELYNLAQGKLLPEQKLVLERKDWRV